jgi:ketosteroid isomerase-like protein
MQVSCVVLIGLAAGSHISAQEMSAVQKEVWQMEEAYWKDVKDLNSDHYATLWHENFLGWPRDRDRPVSKNELMQFAKQKMLESHINSYEFLSKGVTVVGNAGVTQYSVKVLRTKIDGQTETFTSRVTHTWLKTGSTWQIIGGMSAPYESLGHTW